MKLDNQGERTMAETDEAVTTIKTPEELIFEAQLNPDQDEANCEHDWRLLEPVTLDKCLSGNDSIFQLPIISAEGKPSDWNNTPVDTLLLEEAACQLCNYRLFWKILLRCPICGSPMDYNCGKFKDETYLKFPAEIRAYFERTLDNPMLLELAVSTCQNDDCGITIFVIRKLAFEQ